MSNIMKPQAPEYSAPPAPDYRRIPGYNQPPRKSSRLVWITLGILALVCIVGAALLAFGIGIAINTYGGPTIASDQYYTAIKSQDYARAYSFLGSHLKTVHSQQAFTQLAQQQDAVTGKVTHYTYAKTPTGDPATVILTVTRANGTNYTVHLQMQQEAGTWKVTAFDRI